MTIFYSLDFLFKSFRNNRDNKERLSGERSFEQVVSLLETVVLFFLDHLLRVLPFLERPCPHVIGLHHSDHPSLDYFPIINEVFVHLEEFVE